MPRNIRAYPCADCGAWTVRARLSNEPWVCYDCGIRRRLASLDAHRPHTRGYAAGESAGGTGAKE